jgi:hypothetical protein
VPSKSLVKAVVVQKEKAQAVAPMHIQDLHYTKTQTSHEPQHKTNRDNSSRPQLLPTQKPNASVMHAIALSPRAQQQGSPRP